MADWGLLRGALGKVERSVRYTWDELDDLVGGLPPSATNHRTWWSGDRTHVNAWRLAGFGVTDLVLGQGVTFVRHETSAEPVADYASVTPTETAHLDVSAVPTVLLVTCVKDKLSTPAAARDLYVSPLFKKERGYAERAGLPWFILSAEHGLVAPEEWLGPYDRYLPDTPRSYRRVWGMWVTERLELLAGPLRGQAFEIHAGSAYVDAIREPLTDKGVSLLEPLAGLTLGQRLAWYGERASGTPDRAPLPATDASHISTDWFCDQLTITSTALTPGDFLDRGSADLQVPGLYSWWVDDTGAAELKSGLGLPLNAGLIYAGLAGATRWPSGRPSSNTLWSRIAGMHLGARREFSTFRRTLGSILAATHQEAAIDEVMLTTWMSRHLEVVAVPFQDADTLGRLEEDVLRRLDPPLNLKGMAPTPVRRRLTDLRRSHTRKKRSPS